MGKGSLVATLIGGIFLGGVATYAAMRRKTTALEERIMQLEKQKVYLNQTIQTLEGHNKSLKDYVLTQDRKISTLERENSNLRSENSGLSERVEKMIADLNHVEAQVKDDKIKALIRELIERTKRTRMVQTG